jgi:hypothetical protein
MHYVDHSMKEVFMVNDYLLFNNNLCLHVTQQLRHEAGIYVSAQLWVDQTLNSNLLKMLPASTVSSDYLSMLPVPPVAKHT